MPKYEFIELDVHGESGAGVITDDGPKELGRAGYIAALNRYGAEGWDLFWIDVDTHAHVRAIMKREIADG